MFNRLNKFKKNKKGFTLIELLVVIAVIAILIAIIAPNFISATDKANEGAKAAIKHNFDNAVDRFYAENNKYPASDNDTSVSDSSKKFVPDYFNAYDSNDKFTITPQYTTDGTKPNITIEKRTEAASAGTGN